MIQPPLMTTGAALKGVTLAGALDANALPAGDAGLDAAVLTTVSAAGGAGAEHAQHGGAHAQSDGRGRDEAPQPPAPAGVQAAAHVSSAEALAFAAHAPSPDAPASAALATASRGAGAPAAAQHAAPPDPTAVPGARNVDSATLDFRGDNGLEGRLRVILRGDTVRATIVSSEPATVRELSDRVGEIQKALEQRGFAEARITIHDPRAAAGEGAARSDSRDPRRERDANSSFQSHVRDDGQRSERRDRESRPHPNERQDAR